MLLCILPTGSQALPGSASFPLDRLTPAVVIRGSITDPFKNRFNSYGYDKYQFTNLFLLEIMYSKQAAIMPVYKPVGETESFPTYATWNAVLLNPALPSETPSRYEQLILITPSPTPDNGSLFQLFCHCYAQHLIHGSIMGFLVLGNNLVEPIPTLPITAISSSRQGEEQGTIGTAESSSVLLPFSSPSMTLSHSPVKLITFYRLHKGVKSKSFILTAKPVKVSMSRSSMASYQKGIGNNFHILA